MKLAHGSGILALNQTMKTEEVHAVRQAEGMKILLNLADSFLFSLAEFPD
jgi:hypothetical protein